LAMASETALVTEREKESVKESATALVTVTE
jgi:hypothetical protein